jgi:hypothetical protein
VPLTVFWVHATVILDASANMGEWTRMVYSIFPGAMYHLIERSPAAMPAFARWWEEIQGGATHGRGDGAGSGGYTHRR